MLKNLEKNIPSFYKSLGQEFSKESFEKLKKFVVKEKRFYYDFLSNKFLKIKIKEGKKVLKEFKTEVGIYKALERKFDQENRFFPKLISFGKYKNLNWLLEKREEGFFGGEMEKDFRIKKEFLKKIPPSIMAKKFFLYQNLKPKLPLYLHGGWWFGRDFDYHRKNFLEKFLLSPLNKNLSAKDINLAQDLIIKNKKFLDQSANFFCHGDLYPNNLIINKEGNLIILDWSLSTFNNFAFDVAFIYLMAHSLPIWQEKFLKEYLNLIKERERFKELFRIDIISLANRFAGQCYYLKIKEKPERNVFLIFQNYLKFFKKAIYNKL